MALALLLAVSVSAKRPPTWTPQYPDRGLDDATQRAWSQGRMLVDELSKRGCLQADSLLDATLAHLVAHADPAPEPQPELRVWLATGDSPWVAALPNGDLLVHAVPLCLLRHDDELDWLLAHLLSHPRLQHRPEYRSPLERVIACAAPTSPDPAVDAEWYTRVIHREFDVNLQPTHGAHAEEQADSLAAMLATRSGPGADVPDRLRARLGTLSLELECVNLHHESGPATTGTPGACSTALADLQRRLLPAALQDICLRVDQSLALKRPATAMVSPLLDTLVARARMLELAPAELSLMEGQRDLALHGTRDNSLMEAESQLYAAQTTYPGHHELALLRARALVLAKRIEEALAEYKKVEADPAYAGKRGILRITINQLESKRKDPTHDTK